MGEGGAAHRVAVRRAAERAVGRIPAARRKLPAAAAADSIDPEGVRRRRVGEAGLRRAAGEEERRRVGEAAVVVRSPEEAADSTGPGAAAARRIVEQEAAADSNPLAEEGVLRLSVPIARTFSRHGVTHDRMAGTQDKTSRGRRKTRCRRCEGMWSIAAGSGRPRERVVGWVRGWIRRAVLGALGVRGEGQFCPLVTAIQFPDFVQPATGQTQQIYASIGAKNRRGCDSKTT